MDIRFSIRAEKKVNNYLYTHMSFLETVHKHYFIEGAFTLDSANNVFGPFIGSKLSMDAVRKNYVYSKMSVLEEQKEAK